MTQMAKILLSSATALLFIGCGTEVTDSLTGGTSEGGNSISSVSLDMANDKSSFTIILDGNLDSTIEHTSAEYKLFDIEDNYVLDETLIYNGKITTNCQQSAATSETISYSCITKNDYIAIFGKPDDTTKSITLSIGKKYSLYKIDTYVSQGTISVDIDNKKTEIDSFTL